jgi:hypothetical protein
MARIVGSQATRFQRHLSIRPYVECFAYMHTYSDGVLSEVGVWVLLLRSRHRQGCLSSTGGHSCVARTQVGRPRFSWLWLSRRRNCAIAQAVVLLCEGLRTHREPARRMHACVHLTRPPHAYVMHTLAVEHSGSTLPAIMHGWSASAVVSVAPSRRQARIDM